MRRFAGIRRTMVFVLILVFLGCAHIRADEEQKMLTLGSALTKLSAAVESTVRYKNPPAEIGNAELLILATQHDPKLLEPFVGYIVKVLREDKHAIVLICTGDSKRALLEDAGCSPKLDKHLWKEYPPKECRFTLKVREVCQD